jgi:hypothetical protein
VHRQSIAVGGLNFNPLVSAIPRPEICLQLKHRLWQAGGMASDKKSKKNPAVVALGRLGGVVNRRF